jgi:hypothetical protein
MEDKLSTTSEHFSVEPRAKDPDRPIFRIAAVLLAFVLGCLTTWLLKFFSSGNAVNLTAEGFVSLVFTIAVGAASLVLAVLAISFGRVSERIITDRADRSIEIQMRLFEKSLSLQTQLFDKTMSTLEAIGRSTGVTEQRLGDLHSFLQSPELRKQIAGKAVDELRAGGKGIGQAEVEPQLAERLTKNIVRELARSLELPERALEGRRSQSAAVIEPSFEDTFVKEQQKAARKVERQRIEDQLREAVHRIPGVKDVPRDADAVGLWDLFFEYHGKRIAIDVRTPPSSENFRTDTYDDSIRLLASQPADCLIFVFSHDPGPKLLEHISRRNATVRGRIKILVADKVNLGEAISRVVEEAAKVSA